MEGRTAGGMDRVTSERWEGGRAVEGTNGDGRKDEREDGRVKGVTEEGRDGGRGKELDGRREGWTEGGMGGRTE